MLKNSIIKPGHRRARPWGGWLRAAALTALTAGVALASTAHADVDAGATIPGAQSGNITVVAPIRSNTLRTTPTKVQWISHQDCVDNIQLTFNPVVTTPMVGKPLLVFVSNTVDDCLQNSTRNDPTRCHHLPVVSGTEVLGSPLVTFKAQDLTELMGITSCGDAVADGGTSTTSSTAPLSIKIYFMVAPPAMDLVAGEADVNFAIFADSGIDLWGPPPPTDLMVESGDEALQINFADGSNNDSDRLGYYIYIDDGTGTADGGTPVSSTTSGGASTSAAAGAGAGGSTSSTTATGSGGAGGASATSTTGAGGSGGATSSSASSSTSATSSASSSSSASSTSASSAGATTSTGSATMSTGVTSGGNTDACNPSTSVGSCVAASLSLVPGNIPSDVTMDTVETGNLGQVSKLVNGKGYVVAMAAYDDVGNIGKLSDLACGAPAPVDSILRVYQCKGGLTETGCGFCSMGGDRGGSFGALVSAGLIVFGFAARRSRRRAVRTSRGAR